MPVVTLKEVEKVSVPPEVSTTPVPPTSVLSPLMVPSSFSSTMISIPAPPPSRHPRGAAARGGGLVRSKRLSRFDFRYNGPMITADELNKVSGVRHAFFTRRGGVSEGAYASLNCGYGSGDDPERVRANRARAAQKLGDRKSTRLNSSH